VDETPDADVLRETIGLSQRLMELEVNPRPGRPIARTPSVSVVVIVAVGVNSTAGAKFIDVGPSEAETFWRGYSPRKLARLGLRGVKLVVSDAYEGKATVRKVMTPACSVAG
jgi:hypothetical protein